MHVHLTDDDLVLHYYGEMPADEETRAASHLSACGSCQQQYTRLQRVMAVVDSSAAFEAPAGFERTAWARLEPELPPASRGWLPALLWSPVRFGWAAAVFVLVLAAFAAGRLSHRPANAAAPAATNASAESAAERVLLVDLGDHLDRSQMVLVELASAEVGAHGLDVSNERERAEELLASNRLYREAALRHGDRAMASLLDDLERVLVDVAASPSTMSKDDLDAIRHRISDKELLFKVGVVSSQVREREKAAFQTRRPLDTTKG